MIYVGDRCSEQNVVGDKFEMFLTDLAILPLTSLTSIP